MLHVRDVVTSIRFYEKLGFQFIDSEGDDGSIGWARVHCEGGALMFLQSEHGHEVKPDPQGILLYLYADDLAALREQLVAHGIECPAIQFPEHAARGELTLRDPDGYCVVIGHWGQQDHDVWLQRIPEKQAQWAQRR
jgi:catechol 2,3-dioxygenase-like lactoylglutathione lyase family enzyme